MQETSIYLLNQNNVCSIQKEYTIFVDNLKL